MNWFRILDANGNNQLNFRCPLCGDGKKKTSRRGHYYLSTGTYYCWNAGCIAYDKGLSGLQLLSKLTKRSQHELKAELIKRAGTFNSAVLNEDKYKPKKSINDLFKKEDKTNIYKEQLELDKKFNEEMSSNESTP